MNKTVLTITFFLFIGALFGQKKSKNGFDIQDFQEKATDAEWLVEYDMVAWWTSDSVSAQPEEKRQNIGKEWFCFQSEDNVWHAIYGKYSNSNYKVAFHYTVDTSWTVKRSFEQIDSTILNGHSRALITARKQIGNISDSLNLAINQYVRKNKNGTFEVWLLPAFQPNSYAVYGGEYVYTISSNGNQIIKDNSYFQGKFKAYKVDNNPVEIWLNYSELEKPTVGAIFYVWYYKKYFKNIFLETKFYTTTAFKTESTGYTWLHMKREDDKRKKKKNN